MNKKTIRNDLILILSLLLIASIALIFTSIFSKSNNLTATIYVEDEIVEVIDLNKKEERDYFIKGSHGELHVHTLDGSIAIISSNCPHQDCVKMGYTNSINKPIICAYNAVIISLKSNTNNVDVEI